jgi:hypothetical protein
LQLLFSLLRYSRSTISIKSSLNDGCAFSSIQTFREMYSEPMQGTGHPIKESGNAFKKLTPSAPETVQQYDRKSKEVPRQTQYRAVSVV